MSVPVHRADGSLYGTLCATSTEKKLLSERGEHVLKLCRADCPVYSERVVAFSTSRSECSAHRLLLTDVLTGLPNRRAIFEDLNTLFSLGRHLKRNVIIAFIDLDDFKRINDQYGHEAGDQFLIEVGKRLSDEKTEDEIIGRRGR